MGRVRWALRRCEIPHLTPTLSAPGGGEGERQLVAYDFKDARKILHHLAIPKAQDAKALLLQNACPMLIIRAIFLVLRAVELDNQSALEAAEVHDEPLDDALTAEARAVEILQSEMRP